MPFLTYPWALLGLLALPLLVGIYFLRNRYKKRDVSSLFLWDAFTTTREGGLRVTRLQTPWSLWLELLILGLLVLAAVDPRWRTADVKIPLVVVLDNSASMSLSREAAIADLEELWDADRFEHARFILAETEPRNLGSAARNWASMKNELSKSDGWTCGYPEARLDRALAVATEIGGKDARILVLTDQPAQSVNWEKSDRILWRAFGQARDNVAIVNATRSRLGATDRCFVEVKNLGRSSAAPTLEITGRPTESLILNPGESHRAIFNLDPVTPAVEVALSDDVLALDNRATLLPLPARPVKIHIRMQSKGMEALVRRGLNAAGHDTFGNIRPHWLITDQFQAPPEHPDTWMLQLIPEANATALTGPFVIDPVHPMGRGLDLVGTIWGAATSNNVDLATARPIIAAGNTALISSEGRHVTLRWNPQWSNLHQTPNWPILWWNLLDWRRATLPGVAEANVRVGSDVVVGVPREVKAARLQGPATDQQVEPSGRQVRFSPGTAGTWQVDDGTRKTRIAVNFLAPEESDLTNGKSGTWGQWTDASTSRKKTASSAWIWLCLALLALLAHLWVGFRRGGVA